MERRSEVKTHKGGENTGSSVPDGLPAGPDGAGSIDGGVVDKDGAGRVQAVGGGELFVHPQFRLEHVKIGGDDSAGNEGLKAAVIAGTGERCFA